MDDLYVAGRMQKPVRILRCTDQNLLDQLSQIHTDAAGQSELRSDGVCLERKIITIGTNHNLKV